jgi:hypothetical protein
MVHSLSNFQPICLDLIRLIVFTRCAQPFTQLNEAPSKAMPSACAWARRTSENYTRTVHEERPRGRPHPHVGATSEMDDGRRRTAQWLLRSSFRTVLHASDHRFGAGTASSDGILRHRGAYFVEVCRKSTHKCVGGHYFRQVCGRFRPRARRRRFLAPRSLSLKDLARQGIPPGG